MPAKRQQVESENPKCKSRVRIGKRGGSRSRQWSQNKHPTAREDPEASPAARFLKTLGSGHGVDGMFTSWKAPKIGVFFDVRSQRTVDSRIRNTTFYVFSFGTRGGEFEASTAALATAAVWDDAKPPVFGNADSNHRQTHTQVGNRESELSASTRVSSLQGLNWHVKRDCTHTQQEPGVASPQPGNRH